MDKLESYGHFRPFYSDELGMKHFVDWNGSLIHASSLELESFPLASQDAVFRRELPGQFIKTDLCHVSMI